jgi:hypothetical protein
MLMAGVTWSKQRRVDEEALGQLAGKILAAVEHQGRAFPDTGGDVAGHLVAMDAGHQRPHVHIRRVAGADFQGLRAFDDLRHQLVGAGADRHGHGDRHAALTGRTVGGADQRVRRAVEVGIGHHHHVVLGPAQGLHALAVGDALGLDVFRDRRRADEGYRLHIGVFQQGIHRFLVALHHVKGARWQSGPVQQFRGEQRRRRIALRGLEDEGIAAGQRHRRHPHRHHERKVERRDAGRDAERHALAPVVDAAADAVRMLALEQFAGCRRQIR